MSLNTSTFTNLNLDGVLDEFKTILISKGFALVSDRETWTMFAGSMKVRCFKKGNVYLHMASPKAGSPYGDLGRNNTLYGKAVNLWLARQDESGASRNFNFYAGGVASPYVSNSDNAQLYWDKDVASFSNVTILHNSDTVCVIAKDNTGIYHHFGFGLFKKEFTFNDGAYTYAGSNSNYIPFIAESGLNILTDGYVGRVKYNHGGYPVDNEINSVLLTHSPNHFNGVPILAPILIGAEHQGNLSYHGYVEHVRALRVSYIEEGGIITIGNDRWQCFPCVSKNHHSASGLAFRLA